jgi:hypothetical protein
MLEIILGALVALAIRDIIYEIYDRYQHRKEVRNLRVFNEWLEDQAADDD